MEQGQNCNYSDLDLSVVWEMQRTDYDIMKNENADGFGETLLWQELNSVVLSSDCELGVLSRRAKTFQGEDLAVQHHDQLLSSRFPNVCAELG